MQLPCFLCGRLRLPSDGRALWHLPIIRLACSTAQCGARAVCRWKALQPGTPGGAPNDAVGRLRVWPASAAVAIFAMDPGSGGALASFGSIHFTSARRVPAAPQSVECGAAHRRSGVRRSVRPNTAQQDRRGVRRPCTMRGSSGEEPIPALLRGVSQGSRDTATDLSLRKRCWPKRHFPPAQVGRCHSGKARRADGSAHATDQRV
jgi:hypothetical protein